MALTNFNNIKAVEVQTELDNLWRDPQYAKSYSINAATVKAILEHQTANLSFLENPDVDREFTLHWVDFCTDTSDDTVTDADDCENGVCGEGAGKTQALAINIFIKDCYTVSENELRSAVVSYDTVVALGLAKKIKSIVEKFNTKAVAVIAANAGTNQFPGDYTFAAGKTTIPPDDFGAATIIPYLMLASQYNKSQGAFVLDGGNLFTDFYNATKGAINSDNSVGIAALYNDFDYRADIFGFAANAISDYSYLIDKGSVAIANRAKFPPLSQLANEPDGGWIHTDKGSFMRYSIDANIPDWNGLPLINQGALTRQALQIDVQYAKICDTADGLLKPTWMLKLRAGVYTNPLRCDATNTGILAFQKAV